MYTLTVTRDRQTFVFTGALSDLIQQAGEYDTAFIIDPDGVEVYALSFPAMFKVQAV